MQKRFVWIIFVLLALPFVSADFHGADHAPEPAVETPAAEAPVTETPAVAAVKAEAKCPQGAKCTELEKEQDLTKYGCKGCSLNADKYKVTVNEGEGVLLYRGDKVKLSEFPEGTKFVATEDGLQAVLPKKLNKVPKTGSFTVNAEEPIELPTGQKVQGKIAFQEGQMLVRKGESATIDNIAIKTDKNDINVFFKTGKVGVTKGDNFVYFGDTFQVKGDGFTAQLLPGNKYAKVTPNSFLMLSPHNGGTMTLTPSESTVPQLVTTGPPGAKEWGTLWNGNYKTTFGEKGIVRNSIEQLFGKKLDTVPLQADVVDKNGNHLIKDKNGKPHVLLYDDKGRQFVLPADAKINTHGGFTCPGKE